MLLSPSPDSAKPGKDFAYFGWTTEQIDRQLAEDEARDVYPEEPRTGEEKAYFEKERDSSQCQFQYDTMSDVPPILCGHFVFKPLGGAKPLCPFAVKSVIG